MLKPPLRCGFDTGDGERYVARWHVRDLGSEMK